MPPDFVSITVHNTRMLAVYDKILVGTSVLCMRTNDTSKEMGCAIVQRDIDEVIVQLLALRLSPVIVSLVYRNDKTVIGTVHQFQ